MNLQRCFELFKIGPDATIDEVNRAYRDLANIWHPDRFEKNPRLKQKVEAQLKEINLAREKLLAFFDLKARAPKTKEAARRWAQARAAAQAQAQANAEAQSRARTQAQTHAKTQTQDKERSEQQAEKAFHPRAQPSPKTRQEIEKEINRLPLIDVAIWKVISLLDDPNSNFQQVAEQLSPDIATRFLSMARSAFYGRKVESIYYAVRVLGYGQMKKLLITSMLFEHFTKHLKAFSFTKFQIQAQFCAAISKALGQILDYDKLEDLFTVAMLHNIGKLVLAVYFTDHHHRVIDLKKTEQLGTGEAEMRVLGMTHAEIGALLLKRFNIPERICEAVKFHDIQDEIVLGQDDYQLILISKEATGIVRRFALPEKIEPLALLNELGEAIHASRQACAQAMENEMRDKPFDEIFPQLLEMASDKVYSALREMVPEREKSG